MNSIKDFLQTLFGASILIFLGYACLGGSDSASPAATQYNLDAAGNFCIEASAGTLPGSPVPGRCVQDAHVNPVASCMRAGDGGKKIYALTDAAALMLAGECTRAGSEIYRVWR